MEFQTPFALTFLVTVDGDLPSACAIALVDSLRCRPNRISSRSAALRLSSRGDHKLGPRLSGLPDAEHQVDAGI